MAGKKGIEAGRAYVKAWWDNSAVFRGIKAMKAAAMSAGSGLMKLGGGIAGGAAGLGALFVKPIADAGKAQAAFASFETIFKDSSDAMGAWGDDLAKSLGRAKTQVREFMTMTQGRLLAAGVDPAAANEINKQLTTRAFDLAQFWDKDDETAVQAMQNALTGEMEMLKQFGIVISAADTDAKLKAMGLDPRTASQAEKVQARFALIMQRSQETAGTAARESGEFSSLTKRASATVQELSESVGGALLPAVLPVLKAFSDWVGRGTEFIKANAGIVRMVAAAAIAAFVFGGAVAAVGVALSVAGTVLGAVLAVVGALASPFVLAAAGAAGLAGGLIYAAKQGGYLGQIVEWLRGRFGPLLETFTGAFQGIKDALAAGDLKLAAEIGLAALKLAWIQATNALGRTWDEFVGRIDEAFGGFFSRTRDKIRSLQSWVANLLLKLNANEKSATASDLEWQASEERKRRNAIAEGWMDERRHGRKGVWTDEDERNLEGLETKARMARSAADDAAGATVTPDDFEAKPDEDAAKRRADAEAKAAEELAALRTDAMVAAAEADRKAREAAAPAAPPPGQEEAKVPAAAAAARAAVNTAARVDTREGQDAFLRAVTGAPKAITPGERKIADAVAAQTNEMRRQHRETMQAGTALKVEKAAS